MEKQLEQLDNTIKDIVNEIIGECTTSFNGIVAAKSVKKNLINHIGNVYDMEIKNYERRNCMKEIIDGETINWSKDRDA